MRSIYKYSLNVTDKQLVRLPEESEIISVQTQETSDLEILQLNLWAIVDPSKKLEDRTIRIFGTGNPFPSKEELENGNIKLIHIDTTQMVNGRLVWHVFEEVSA